MTFRSLAFSCLLVSLQLNEKDYGLLSKKEMSLSVYNRRRNFDETPEPVGVRVTGKRERKIFVVQKHASAIDHYDLRLEVGGVLKSWAIPKGPSMNHSDRRLAIMVEDHPTAYANFKGIIPEGNYGAGKIEIFDRGFFVPYGNEEGYDNDRYILRQIKAGCLRFTLKGRKFKGVFSLVRMQGANASLWLLIKGNDKYAVDYPYQIEESVSANFMHNRMIA